jgi:transposase
MSTPEVQTTLRAYLTEFVTLKTVLAELTREARDLSQAARHSAVVTRLMTHPGIGWLTALVYAVEVFQPERFSGSRQVSNYLGLAPLVRQSGDRSYGGPTVKGGRDYLRAMLVESAWNWKRRDVRGRELYNRMFENTGCSQKAIVAVARHLGVNLWRMLITEEDYRPTTQ